jgi:hypothetical protein
MSGTPGQSPLANLRYNSAAILSRQLQDVFTVAAGSTPTKGTVLSAKEFTVDPNCPFFYIFAGGALSLVDSSACETTFQFCNGGSILSSISFGWGNSAVLDSSGQPFRVSLGTCPNDGIMNIHDPNIGNCVEVMGTDDTQGFIKRWTALCDTVKVSTVLLHDWTSQGTPVGLVHGILQQPW